MRMRMVVSETAPRVFLLVNISRRSKKHKRKKGDKKGQTLGRAEEKYKLKRAEIQILIQSKASRNTNVQTDVT